MRSLNTGSIYIINIVTMGNENHGHLINTGSLYIEVVAKTGLTVLFY